MASLQEANKQVPGMADTLCLAAKAWSDTCYMDEIQSPFKERLTMQDRHDVNKKAMEYAKQVGGPMLPAFERRPGSEQRVAAISGQDLGLHVLLTHELNLSSLRVMWLLQLQAIVLAPNKALPHVAACISMGRLAVFSDNKTKVRGQPTPLSHPPSRQPPQHHRLAHVPEGELRGTVSNSQALSAAIGFSDTIQRQTE